MEYLIVNLFNPTHPLIVDCLADAIIAVVALRGMYLGIPYVIVDPHGKVLDE